MKKIFIVGFAIGLLLTACVAREREPQFVDKFTVAANEWSSTGGNRNFILEPGYTLVLDGTEGDKAIHLVITVLNETSKIDGVETRVVEERETADGQLVEVSRNYFAASTKTKDVYYFGEDVDIYEDGKVTGHEGSWHAGENGAKYGLMMPGSPRIGDRYYQEVAGEVARDRAEIIGLSEPLTTRAGKFENCLQTKETTPLKQSEVGYKFYAPGVGLVRDGNLLLTRYGKTSE
jgi:hypothetical protein